ncbi:MAG: metallophosphoesterase [Nitrospirae bacterium]|nr:MAG: metallophosphoesterase [Nitrospirota bacterium]
MSILIGVIADTHGLVRPEMLEKLRGVSLILHAGDVGSPSVLERLEKVAPVIAVRGNNDRGPWAETLPITELVQVDHHWIYVLHELDRLDLDPAAAQFSAVIYGHSHRPMAEYRKGVLFLNPGSAGPRRFRLPITVARLIVDGDRLAHEIHELPG